ncbi:ACP S-malonyltransferase [Flexivirga caeni]|uniref:Malonyl CoA-acyl carrier protein transacylase n=1 Tax=Flexivirga caeni TaxID=2294115 RepID=A0A3M9M4N5_9MICO|nr:ACP S-malonyltransferase [Flexivirga caeni]RNI20500.1 ACP S-malonyltransferase [Flexivirga caeni]
MLAIVCPGQGSQTPGFLTPWLEVPGFADHLHRLSQVADTDLVAHGTTSDAETIKDTAVAQPLIVATGLGTLSALLDDADLAGDAVLAGHSVGEITAAAAASVLSEDDAMRFVTERGNDMARAAAVTPTGMAAVLGGDEAEVLVTLESLGLTPANRNGAGQIVAAGTLEQLAALQEAPPAKARVIPLQVAGAFHTAHMAPAVDALREHAASLEVHDPRVRLLSNKDGGPVSDGTEVVDRLVAQVAGPVRWDATMQTMLDLGVTGLIELCPAGTLVGLAKRGMRGVASVAVKTPDDLDKARDLLREHTSNASQGS